MSVDFANRYGPWAIVAGASEGLGAAFARELTSRGLNVILAARRREPLEALAQSLPTRAVPVVADLATQDGIDALVTAAAPFEVGLVVANAALSPVGPFLNLGNDRARQVLDLNCAMPVVLAQMFLPPMVDRRRGGFIVMSSLAGMQGFPPVALYAATKAFGAILAEGLWAELAGSGVDVSACVAGAIETPGLVEAMPNQAPGTLSPERVVTAALRGLGRGPRTIPGAFMRVSSTLMSRLLPRRTQIGIISRASRDLRPGV